MGRRLTKTQRRRASSKPSSRSARALTVRACEAEIRRLSSKHERLWFELKSLADSLTKKRDQISDVERELQVARDNAYEAKYRGRVASKLTREESALLSNGDTIAAIKLVQTRARISLRDAHTIVSNSRIMRRMTA